jgi:type II secretory pathway pseudopilin PulG
MTFDGEANGTPKISPPPPRTSTLGRKRLMPLLFGLCIVSPIYFLQVEEKIVPRDVILKSPEFFFSDTRKGTGNLRTSPTPEKVNQDAAAALKLYQQRLQQYQQQHQQNENVEGFQRRRPVPSQPDCIVAFHIPKTGGTSLRIFLDQVKSTMEWMKPEWYHYRNRYQDKSPSKLGRGTIDKYMIREKVIHTGHFTPVFLKETATQNCLTVTMLREPIDRVVSAFYYHNHTTSEWESCLKHDTLCQYARYYQNDVTRLFSANVTWNAYNYEAYLAERVDREHLKRAQQFLMDTDLVCFLDQFDDCKRELLAMANLTGTVSPSAGPEGQKRVNVGKKRETITAATRSKIELVNSLDIELYKWAVQQFRGRNRRRKR